MAHHEINETLQKANDDFLALKRSYERYWQGLERPEPERERDRLRQIFRRLLVDIEGPSNTAIAFRVRTAQTSFRAFDELCERRNRDPNVLPLEQRRKGSAPSPHRQDDTVVAPRPVLPPLSTAPSAFDDLYKTLVHHLQDKGQAAPNKDKFVRQVEMHLARAKLDAPDKALRAELSFDESGRPKLIVVEGSRP